MSSGDLPAPEVRGRRGGEIVLTLAVLGALLAALLPVVRVVRPGGWLPGAVILATLILAAGFVARRFRLPAIAVTLIEAGVWVGFMTLVFLRDSAFLLILPTPASFRELPGIVDDAMQTIVLGAAPLEETAALGFFIVGAMGLLAIIVDHVVLTARMPLLASIGIVAVSLIPSIAVQGEVDVSAFVFLAVAILFLIRAETRSRERPLERESERSAGVPATALGIGAVAIVVAVVATPLLPQPGMRASAGFGPGGGIDATLQLGDDLRRPQEVEVLRVRTDAANAPYLRATTVSSLDGARWEPDRVRTVPLQSEEALGPVSVDADVRLNEYTTTVQVTNLATLWLPVAYPAVEVSGLEGTWSAVPYNRTVVPQGGLTQGQSYEIVTNVPRPTLEQIRAASAGGPELRDETTELPAGMPGIIGEMAAEVTAEATNDYDELVALQRWFRGGEFDYSLEAPVEDGFDGSGADAVARFLEEREGYCVHFASAFALMARTLGMPSRIVVGYLPGTATGEIEEAQTVYSVSSQLLHAWPEVFFEGIGWVPFEPTVGLGVPTTFSPAAATPGDPNDPNNPVPLETPQPTSTAELSPEDPNNPREDAAGGSGIGSVNLLPALGVLLGILLVLSIPAVVRELRRRQLAAAARTGDAASAWMMAQDAAIDLAIPVPSSESPRAFALRLVQEYGAPPDAMNTLVRSIERASYAPYGFRDFGAAEQITDAAAEVRAALLREAPPSRRILAIVAPRSLIIRPGSLYAGTAGGGRPAR